MGFEWEKLRGVHLKVIKAVPSGQELLYHNEFALIFNFCFVLSRSIRMSFLPDLIALILHRALQHRIDTVTQIT